MNIDFNKGDGLVPAIIQDSQTLRVLMLGYMNKEALKQTQEEGKVTFWSRSKNRLWTKGESSGNFLNVVDIKLDCDNDTLLIKAKPDGPTCHKGDDTCWKEQNTPNALFLEYLESIIVDRKESEAEGSYTASLFQKGINKIAQKVGEEAVEIVIEAKDDNEELFLNEAADLMFHLEVLIVAKGYSMKDVIKVLNERHS